MSKLVPLNVIAAVFSLLLAVPAQAQSAAGAPGADDDQTSDAAAKPATLAAFVTADGKLKFKKNALFVVHFGNTYTVSFNRNVSGCFYTATAAAAAEDGGATTAIAQPEKGQKKAVLVNTFGPAGAAPAPFYLVVTCFK